MIFAPVVPCGSHLMPVKGLPMAWSYSASHREESHVETGEVKSDRKWLKRRRAQAGCRTMGRNLRGLVGVFKMFQKSPLVKSQEAR